jgi:hypothetical protein
LRRNREKILNPTDGVSLKPSSGLFARTEAERFSVSVDISADNERSQASKTGVSVGQSGAPARYDMAIHKC